MDDATRLADMREYQQELARSVEIYLKSAQDWLDLSHSTRNDDRQRIYYQNYLSMKQRAFECEGIAGRLERLLEERSA